MVVIPKTTQKIGRFWSQWGSVYEYQIPQMLKPRKGTKAIIVPRSMRFRKMLISSMMAAARLVQIAKSKKSAPMMADGGGLVAVSGQWSAIKITPSSSRARLSIMRRVKEGECVIE